MSKAFKTLPPFITNYMAAEVPIVRQYAKGSVLDIGAGVGRALSMLDPKQVTEYHAIEPNPEYISEFIDEAVIAKKKGIPVGLSPHTFEDSLDLFKDKQFDTSLVLWNTISTGWCGNEQELLEPLSNIAKSALFTVIAPGNLNTRLNYYVDQDIKVDKIDPKIDLVNSGQWERNRAYSIEQLNDLFGDNWRYRTGGTITYYVNYIIADSKKKFD